MYHKETTLETGSENAGLCYNAAEMAKQGGNKPECSVCGECCKKLGYEVRMTPGDYRRWKHQERDDILSYALLISGSGGRGYLWFDPEIKLELDCCPFLTEYAFGKYSCAIQETKPMICRKFWCAWTYGAGERSVPFKVATGWTEKARKLGYGKKGEKPPLVKAGSSEAIFLFPE
ncbi:MAG: hypothetical protein V3R96_08755 [Dehalococcoidales bacterium]